MLKFPFRPILGISAISAAVPKFFQIYPSYCDAFAFSAGLFLVQAFLWAGYTILIYPFFVSPLRHLPQPKGGHFLLGHGLTLAKRVPGLLAKEWYV